MVLKMWSRPSNISVTQQLGRNANSQVPAHIHQTGNSGTSDLCSNKLCRWFFCLLKSEMLRSSIVLKFGCFIGINGYAWIVLIQQDPLPRNLDSIDFLITPLVILMQLDIGSQFANIGLMFKSVVDPVENIVQPFLISKLVSSGCLFAHRK